MTTIENIDSNEAKKSSDNDSNPVIKSSSSEAVIGILSNLVEDKDVMQIIDSQRNMLSRFEKTNEMLVNCNALAVIRFENANRDLRRYTQQLTEMQKDLDSVYHRIKFLKLKLSQQYPNAFKVCSNVYVFDEEEEEITEDMKNVKISEVNQN